LFSSHRGQKRPPAWFGLTASIFSIMAAIEHLYVHIPFCHRICPYCSFHKHTPGGHDMGDFFRALLHELSLAQQQYDLSRLRTIYFGGGTPTLPSLSHLRAFLEKFTTQLDLRHLSEWTFEANPMTFDTAKIRLLREAGVTRLSLGVQSWDPETLHTLGRDHTPTQAEEAYAILRAESIPIVSLDLMFSIPGQTEASWAATLEKTIALQPDHISAYNLNYEEDTAFFDQLQAGHYALDDERDARFFHHATTLLPAAGYDRYEISNYARTGYESVHNQAYWDGRDYLGLGPGAFSTVGADRWKNLAETKLYQACLLSGGDIRTERESLTPTQKHLERVALLLRTRRGLALSDLPDRTDAISQLCTQGLAEVQSDYLTLTDAGRLVADSVTLWLTENDSPA
jgi:oxygen-independent coproporphyrinogen III oxidase